MAHRVFVYGTLKRGFPNFELGGMARHRFLGMARTRQAYPLVTGGRWRSPYLLPEPGAGHRVRGELHAMDDAGLAALDALEGVHAPNSYSRRLLEVASEDGSGAPLEVWSYLRQRAHIEGALSEPMDEYRLDPRYVPPDRRA